MANIAAHSAGSAAGKSGRSAAPTRMNFSGASAAAIAAHEAASAAAERMTDKRRASRATCSRGARHGGGAPMRSPHHGHAENARHALPQERQTTWRDDSPDIA